MPLGKVKSRRPRPVRHRDIIPPAKTAGAVQIADMLGRLSVVPFIVAVFGSLLPFTMPAKQSAPGSAPESPTAAHAPEIPADCTGAAPQEPVSQIEGLSSPSTGGSGRAEAFDALGRSLGKQGNFRCARAAFEAALSLDPDSFESRYDLALALLSMREPQRAADELRTLLKAHPDSYQAHNVLGLALRDLRDTQNAREEYQAALRINPRFASAAYNLGQLLLAEKEYAVAIRRLQQALINSPEPDLALDTKIALAAAFAQSGDYEHALPLLQEAILLKPDSAELHFDLATVLAHREDYESAVTEFDKTLALAPDHDGALLSLAKALMNESAVDQAIPYLKRFVERNPQNPEGFEIFGDALKESSKFSDAEKVLRRAVQLDPSDYKAHYDLGVVFDQLGKREEAVRELQAAVRLKPDFTDAHYRLARILNSKKERIEANRELEKFAQLKAEGDRKKQASQLSSQASGLLDQGHAKESAEAYRQAIQLVPQDARLHYNLAVALSRTGDSAGQFRELQRALALDPEFALAHNLLGSLYMMQGRVSKAEQEFRSAVHLDPHSADARNNLGTALGRQGRNDEAAGVFQEAVELDPQFTQAYVNLGLSYAAKGSYPEAEKQLNIALRLDAKNANALTAMGILQGKTGRDSESVETFKKLTALYPSSPDAHTNLGIALGDVYNLQGALAEFSEAIRLAPNSAMARFNKGRVLYALNRREDAKQELAAAIHIAPNYVDALFLLGVIEHSSPFATQLFQRVVALQPGNADAHFYLGRNLMETGKKAEAIAHWKAAVSADPDNHPAVSSLARVLAQEKSPEAPEYIARLKALEERRQLTDRVQQLNNFALRAASDNNWPQALDQLQEAIKLCGQCVQLPVLRKNLGLLYARKGDAENAKHQLRLALQLLPEGPEAKAAAETLRRLESAPR